MYSELTSKINEYEALKKGKSKFELELQANKCTSELNI